MQFSLEYYATYEAYAVCHFGLSVAYAVLYSSSVLLQNYIKLYYSFMRFCFEYYATYVAYVDCVFGLIQPMQCSFPVQYCSWAT